MADVVEKTPPPAAKPKKRRWPARLFVAVVVLIVLVAVGGEIVFRTNFPRTLVISQVEKQLALRVGATSLTTGWMGHTELHNVSLGLPLSDKAFVNVPIMKVENSSLFGLLLGRSISIQRIELDNPTVYVWQESSGRWNLQQAVELVARAAGKKPAEDSSQTAAPQLPNIKITNAQVLVIDNQKRETTISQINVDGIAESAVSWRYDVTVQPDAAGTPRVGLRGRVAPGGFWAHEVGVQVHDVGIWLKPWLANTPDLHVDMQWSGQLAETGVVGRLDAKKISVGTSEAYGTLIVQTIAGGVRISPDNLLLKTTQHILPDVKLTSGAIEYNGVEVQVRQLMLNAMGGPARVDASYNPSARRANLTAIWSQLALGKGVKQSGSFNMMAQWPLSNQMQLAGRLLAQGTAPGGPYDADVQVAADGTSWTDFSWTMQSPKLAWHRSVPVVLDDLKLSGGLHWQPIPNSADRAPILTLDSASLGGGRRLASRASYNFDPGRQDWLVHMEGGGWSMRSTGPNDLTFVLDGHGDKAISFLDHLTFQNADATLTLDGSYTYGLPKPVRATMRLSNAEPPALIATGVVQQAPKILHGLLSGSTTMVGTLSPLLLDVTGQAKGREVDILQRHLGEIAMNLSGTIDAERADIKTDTLKLLDGDWNLEAVYLLESDATNLLLGVKNLSLKEVGAAAGQPDVTGTLSGEWKLDMPATRVDTSALRLTGAATLNNVSSSGFSADAITLTTKLENNQFTVDPITIQRGDGRGNLKMSVNLKDLRHLAAGATITNWPIDIPGSPARVDAWVEVPDVLIDLPNPGSSDPRQHALQTFARQVDVHGNVALVNKALANFQVSAGVWGQMVDVRGLHAQILNGRADGQARLNLADFTTSTAEILWDKIDMTQLAGYFPQVKDLRGELSGTARLAPAEVPHPLEPLAIVIKNKFVRGAWRTVPLDDATIIAFVGTDPLVEDGGYRVVLGSGENETSTIRMNGGAVKIWGRAGKHAHDTLGAQADVSFDNLELDTLVHAFDVSAAPMPGKLAGAFKLLYATTPQSPEARHAKVIAANAFPVQAPATLPTTSATTKPALYRLLDPIYADAEINLSRTNLANFGPISFLYNVMHPGKDLNVPEGKGNVRLHLEKGTLAVTELKYFNRGVEARGVATIHDVWNIPDSPINGTIVGNLKALGQTKLPLLADVDAVLAAVQADLTTIVVEGTLRNSHERIILFGDAGGDLRRMVVGDAQSGAAGAGR